MPSMTRRLKSLFFISIPLFISHGLEELFTGFYEIDYFTKFVFGFFTSMSVPQATFWVFQIMLWLILLLFACLTANEKWRLRLMFVPGVIFIFELHHPWSALVSEGYYPGLLSSIPLLFVGFLFWGELLRTVNKTS